MSDINENTKLIPADITMDEGDGVAPARSYGSGNDTGTFQQGPGELPEPFQLPTENGAINVTCRVCQGLIDITNKRDQHVVKCIQCNEATPIRDAPNGKKYVRCPCNCLLICRTVSLKIACPRPNCKRIINLQPSPITPPIPFTPGLCKVSCAHCHDSFLFNTLHNHMPRCPHCQRVSSVGQRFARIRCVLYTIATLLFLGGTILTAVYTYDYARSHKAFYLVYVLLFVIFVAMFNRLIYFSRIKISVIDETMT